MKIFSKQPQKKPGMHLEPLSQVSCAPSNLMTYTDDRKSTGNPIANVKAKSNYLTIFCNELISSIEATKSK